MNNFRQLAPGAYLVAAVLFFFPLVDSSFSLSPWNVGSAQWRFGAVGLMSNTLMIVALGALIAVATSVLAGQDRPRRIIGLLCWVLAIVLLVAIAGFGLDAVQSRLQIRADLMNSYSIASLTAEVKLLLGALSFALFGRAARNDNPVRSDSHVQAVGVLVGRRDKAAS